MVRAQRREGLRMHMVWYTHHTTLHVRGARTCTVAYIGASSGCTELYWLCEAEGTYIDGIRNVYTVQYARVPYIVYCT
jgi:hypothetical protein